MGSVPLRLRLRYTTPIRKLYFNENSLLLNCTENGYASRKLYFNENSLLLNCTENGYASQQ